MIALPTWVAVIGPLVALATIFVGLGRVLNRLDTIATEHATARAESKAQHEETRREIASLREDRVRAEATAEHLRADVETLKTGLTKLSARVDENDRAQNTARHTQTESLTTTMASLVTAAVSREFAERDARGNGRTGRR